jgi:hypothetical protein
MQALPPQEVVTYNVDKQEFRISFDYNGRKIESSFTREDLNKSFEEAMRAYEKKV